MWHRASRTGHRRATHHVEDEAVGGHGASASTSSTPRCATAQQTPGVDFSLEDKLVDRRDARRARHRLCRGRLSRRQPDRHRLLRRAAGRLSAPRFTAFGMTKRAGRSRRQRSGLARRCCGQGRRHLLRRQGLGLHVRVALGITQRGKPRGASAQIGRGRRARRPRGAGRLRAFLRRLQGQSRLCARLLPGRPTRPARAGWCCATPMAARCRTRSRRIVRAVAERVPGDQSRHPRPRRHREAVANSLAAVEPARARSRAR